MSTSPSYPPIQVTSDEWKLVQHILLNHLYQQIPDAQVLVFGSRATGKARQYSDLDLAIVSHKPELSYQLSALKEAFERSDLPWTVDLINWQTTSKAFQQIITQDSIEI